MLHAIGVSGAGIVPGRELWAFIPPSQLEKIAHLQAGVDGSPGVADVYIDDGTGKKTWQTVLAVTCGEYGGTLDLLDITDPLNPKYLWTAESDLEDFAMGSAQGAVIFVWEDGRKVDLIEPLTFD